MPRPSWVDEVKAYHDGCERISKTIAAQVDRYVRFRRWLVPLCLFAAFAGQWLGWGAVEITKWYWAIP